jgi:hypothetical protein
MPIVIVLSLTWIFSTILLFIALSGSAHLHSNTQSGLLITIAVVFSSYLAYFTWSYIGDFASSYEFELRDNEMRLRVFNKYTQEELFAQMPFSEVHLVEYYSPRNNAELIFHGADDRIIKVALWSMTDDIAPIIEFLKRKGLKIERL